MASDPYVSIAMLDNAIEAQLLESILEERSIPHRIRSFHDTAYDGLYQFQKGWAEVLAPPEFRVDIMEVLSDLRRSTDAAPPRA